MSIRPLVMVGPIGLRGTYSCVVGSLLRWSFGTFPIQRRAMDSSRIRGQIRYASDEFEEACFLPHLLHSSFLTSPSHVPLLSGSQPLWTILLLTTNAARPPCVVAPPSTYPAMCLFNLELLPWKLDLWTRDLIFGHWFVPLLEHYVRTL